MEIINTYGETISHYTSKLNVTEEYLNDAVKGLQELEILAEDGWEGKSGEALIEKFQEIRRALTAPKNDLDDARNSLSQLGTSIEEEIAKLAEQIADAVEGN